MVSEKGGVVVMERGRFICGANLLRRWNRGRGFLAQQVACYKITPYGLLGPNSEGGMEFTRDVDVSRPEYLDDVEPWRGRKIICFDMDEVEELERTEDVVYIELSMPLLPQSPRPADATIQDFKSALDYAQRLREKQVDPDEIQYRLYELGPSKWSLRQWQAHCLANEIPYPPDGPKGEADRDKYAKAYGRGAKRHLARVASSEKSEKVPE